MNEDASTSEDPRAPHAFVNLHNERKVLLLAFEYQFTVLCHDNALVAVKSGFTHHFRAMNAQHTARVALFDWNEVSRWVAGGGLCVKVVEFGVGGRCLLG